MRRPFLLGVLNLSITVRLLVVTIVAFASGCRASFPSATDAEIDAVYLAALVDYAEALPPFSSR